MLLTGVQDGEELDIYPCQLPDFTAGNYSVDKIQPQILATIIILCVYKNI